ncbi:MAG: IS256 family transposase, partial [Candidatus Hydrogenedens sp.]|nr:IS256 family transposase [Candidatus Hydrogenedens sp.]
MTKRNDDGYLSEIQDHMDGDALRTMAEVMIRHVMREELEAHLGAGPHERTGERRGYRNGY